MNEPEHRALRELIGAYVLGHLGADERHTLQAHLDGCASCRAELAELEPLAGLLDGIDSEHFETPPHPPAELGERIRDAVATEAGQRRRARRGVPRRGLVALAAAAVVVVALAAGLVGRATAPEPAPPPLEPVALETPRGSDVRVADANLVAHTWGVELRFVADGFAAGDTFRAAFRDAATGRLEPAGRFIGTGPDEMTCNLQSAVLRDDVSEVVVTDASGDVVLSADL